MSFKIVAADSFGDALLNSGRHDADQSEDDNKPLRFKVLNGDELAALPPASWLVKNVLPLSGVAAIYGTWGAGKTFVALDLLAAVTCTDREDWFGYRIKNRVPVAYVCLEGAAGIAQRMKAYRLRHGVTPQINFVPCSLNLLNPADRRGLVEALKDSGFSNGVLVIDTLAAATPGMEENSSADMGAAVAALQWLQRELGGLVLVVHHAGKDTSKGMRGHSNLTGAIDAAIEVSRNNDRREIALRKVKDAEDGAVHGFRLEKVELGEDEDGDPVRSCVVQPDHAAVEVRTVKLPTGGNQKLVLEALRPLLKESKNFGRAGAPAMRPCIELEAAITSAAGRLTCASDKRTSRTREAVTGLVARGVLGLNEGWLWMV